MDHIANIDGHPFADQSKIGIKISICMPSVILQQASVCSVPDSYVQGLVIWTRWYPRNLPKEINLLPFFVICLCTIYMHKICRFCNHHKLTIWWKPDWPRSTQVIFQNCNRWWKISYIPNSGCLVLISGGKYAAIRMPCRSEGVI